MTKRNFLRIVLPVGALAVAGATAAPIIVGLEKNQASNNVIKANSNNNTVAQNFIYENEVPFDRDLNGLKKIVEELKTVNLLPEITDEKLEIAFNNQKDKEKLLFAIDQINAQIVHRGLGSWLKDNWLGATSLAVSVASLIVGLVR